MRHLLSRTGSLESLFGRGCLVGAMVLSSCAPQLREAVSYRGDEFSGRIAASELQSVAILPESYELIGSLTTSCHFRERFDVIDEAWLSDVDCSVARLQQVLRERAAAAGAEVLVRERCGLRRDRRAEGNGTITCRARAARPEPDLLVRRPPKRGRRAPPPSDGDDPTGSQAWRIRIAYQPTADVPLGSARPAAAVVERRDLPASHRSVGAIVSRCEEGCSLDAVRAALRVTAGRLGASDVVGISCVEQSPRIVCVGTAAQYEHPPSLSDG